MSPAYPQLLHSNNILYRNLEDVILPLHEPVRGTYGHDIGEIVVPKGTSFVCNLRACNTNKAIWGEDADEWKPERWLQPLPKTVEDARIPGIYSHLCAALFLDIIVAHAEGT